MAGDIRIKNGNDRYKFRVGGIVESDGKFLVVKMNQNDFYCFAGGHVELFEDTKTALERELKEELFFDVEVNSLIGINENFYKLRGDNFHELCFYYSAKPKNKVENYFDKIVEEKDKNGVVRHCYKWLNKKELETFDVRPKQIVEHIIKNKKGLKHFITRN